MAYKRSLQYFSSRFHRKQTTAWLGYKAGLTIVLPWGRRSGKSDFFAEVLIEDVENYAKPCLYLASTQDSAREIMWPKFRTRLQNNPDWKLQDSNLEAIHKPTNTPIRFRGVEKVDNLAGKAYRIVVCDEFALWKRDPNLTIKQIIAPMIADFDGLIMYGSSKRGKNHFYELHEKAKEDKKKYFVEECTIFDNPFINENGRKKVITEYDGENDPLYRQEILNEYVTFQGMVFALDSHAYTNKRIQSGDLDHAYHVRGVDHGYSPDPTACVWLAYNEKYGYWQVYSEYKQAALLINQHAEIITKQEPFEIQETISDIDPQVIAEYDAVGLSMQKAGKYDKQARLLRLVNALRTGNLKIADNCTMLLKEMASYEWNQDGNDHLIDALIYGYTNATLEKVKQETQEDDDDVRPSHIEEYSQDFG